VTVRSVLTSSAIRRLVHHPEATMLNLQCRAMLGAFLGVLLGFVLGPIIGVSLASFLGRVPKTVPAVGQPDRKSREDWGRAVLVEVAVELSSEVAGGASIVQVVQGIVLGGVLGAILGAVGGAGAATRQKERAVSPPAKKPPPDESVEPDRMIHTLPSFLISPPNRSAERDQLND
jgi:hypothetical protein